VRQDRSRILYSAGRVQKQRKPRVGKNHAATIKVVHKKKSRKEGARILPPRPLKKRGGDERDQPRSKKGRGRRGKRRVA